MASVPILLQDMKHIHWKISKSSLIISGLWIFQVLTNLITFSRRKNNNLTHHATQLLQEPWLRSSLIPNCILLSRIENQSKLSWVICKKLILTLLPFNVFIQLIKEFSQLLYLLRIIKLDPNNGTSFVNQYVRSILERSENKVKELELESTLSRLSYFYQEYASLGARHASVVARRINHLLNTNNTEVEFQNLAVNEINLILKGMRCKPQLSSEEHILLRHVIKTVLDKHFDKLSFLELAQISVGINEVVSSNNSDVFNSSNAEQIHKKVLANIDEMDEKSIMYILNAKKTNNRTYNQIYKIIFDKILD